MVPGKREETLPGIDKNGAGGGHWLCEGKIDFTNEIGLQPDPFSLHCCAQVVLQTAANTQKKRFMFSSKCFGGGVVVEVEQRKKKYSIGYITLRLYRSTFKLFHR